MLKIKNISKSFTNGLSTRKVLNEISLEVNKGDTIAIVGPSGSGKTTLLNIIGSLDTADSGEIKLGETDYSKITANDLSTLRNRKIGMVFQFHHLLPQCNVWENVLLPTLPLNIKDGSIEARAEALLKQTGIWEQRFQKPSSLSGGECQRTAVVRALINNPELILADEPTGALDHSNAVKLIDTIIDLNRIYGTTLILVTHSLEIASKMGKKYNLNDGKLEQL
ncbi:MAG: ABC transporter ATP-binding protein [Prolixibacteraceae bacterium]|nr:ABC transporter ATP-binding protein [Prolixibacteraceae bacterium]